MSNPDFSQSPEHVALAKAMFEAAFPGADWQDPFYASDVSNLLISADAAITHLGSGYRLPDATEANALRLARFAYGSPKYIDQALDDINALRAAFAEPAEKPEPVFAGTPAPEPEAKCNCADCSPANWPDTNGWRCGKKKPEPRPYPPGPTPCGDAKFIPPTGARPDGSLVTHVVPPTPEEDSPADPTVCRPGCDRKFGHLGPHSDEMQEEIIPRRVIFTALASNPHLLKRLMDIDVRHARVRMIREWAETFEEAACKK